MWKFGYGKGVKGSKIKDGTSNTVVASEVLTVDGNVRQQNSDDIRGVWISSSMGASVYTHGYINEDGTQSLGGLTPNNVQVMDAINGCETDSRGRDIPVDSPLRCRLVRARGDKGGDTYASARSQHPGGVVTARADGSVQFVPDGIDQRIWYALGTRARKDRADDT